MAWQNYGTCEFYLNVEHNIKTCNKLAVSFWSKETEIKTNISQVPK